MFTQLCNYHTIEERCVPQEIIKYLVCSPPASPTIYQMLAGPINLAVVVVAAI